jgi:hypothetical protein
MSNIESPCSLAEEVWHEINDLIDWCEELSTQEELDISYELDIKELLK